MLQSVAKQDLPTRPQPNNAKKKNLDLPKNLSAACFQKKRESLWDAFSQMETATTWAPAAELGNETPAVWEEQVPSSTRSVPTWSRHPKQSGE